MNTVYPMAEIRMKNEITSHNFSAVIMEEVEIRWNFRSHEKSLIVYIMLSCAVENRHYGRRGSAALTMRHPSIRKSWH
jgi:hypothetical protein